MNRKPNILQSVQMLRALAVMIVMLMTTATTAWAQQVPWSGLGTKDNPYVIKTTQELDELAWRVNNHPIDDCTSAATIGKVGDIGDFWYCGRHFGQNRAYGTKI